LGSFLTGGDIFLQDFFCSFVRFSRSITKTYNLRRKKKMKRLQTNKIERSTLNAKEKQGGKIKKFSILFLAGCITFGSFASANRAQSADLELANKDLGTTAVTWPQTYQWLFDFFFSYLKYTQPDFRVSSVKTCYYYSYPDPYPKAYVHVTTENIGGNLGIQTGSHLDYSHVEIGTSYLGFHPTAPYWGQPDNSTSVHWISNRWKSNVGTVEIGVNEYPQITELNYTNNVSTWSVVTDDYKLNGCYDMVQVK
jgi:hypothetical protein